MVTTRSLPVRKEPTVLDPTGIDAYAPAVIARRAEKAAQAKARMAFVPILTLAVLAGAFIALGGAFFTATIAGHDAALGLVRLAGGVAFSLGLVLVVVAGAELFTGNALMTLAAVEGLIGWRALARNWAIVLLGNACGAVGIAVLLHLGGVLQGPYGEAAKAIASAKAALPMAEAFWRGVACNVLVCLAVWMSLAARTAAGKVLVVVPPIAAFVALGLEHSVANLFLVPQGMLAGAEAAWVPFAANLLAVVAGNVVGGAGGVALAYRLAYGLPRSNPDV